MSYKKVECSGKVWQKIWLLLIDNIKLFYILLVYILFCPNKKHLDLGALPLNCTKKKHLDLYNKKCE
jgi:hypothetical protein